MRRLEVCLIILRLRKFNKLENLLSAKLRICGQNFCPQKFCGQNFLIFSFSAKNKNSLLKSANKHRLSNSQLNRRKSVGLVVKVAEEESSSSEESEDDDISKSFLNFKIF